MNLDNLVLMYNGQILVDFKELADKYTKAEIDHMMQGLFTYKGTLATLADLYALQPADLSVGDCYNIEETGSNYAWAGTAWDKLSETVDLSVFYTKTQIDSKVAQLNTKIDELNLGVLTINSVTPDANGNFNIQETGKLSDYCFTARTSGDYWGESSLNSWYVDVNFPIDITNPVSQTYTNILKQKRGIYINDIPNFSNTNCKFSGFKFTFETNGNFRVLPYVQLIYLLRDNVLDEAYTYVRNSESPLSTYIPYMYTINSDNTITRYEYYKYNSSYPGTRTTIIRASDSTVLTQHFAILYESALQTGTVLYADINSSDQSYNDSGTTYCKQVPTIQQLYKLFLNTYNQFGIDLQESFGGVYKTFNTRNFNFNNFSGTVMPIKKDRKLVGILNDWFNFSVYDKEEMLKYFPECTDLVVNTLYYGGGKSLPSQMASLYSATRVMKNTSLGISNTSYFPYYIIDGGQIQVGDASEEHSAYYVSFSCDTSQLNDFKVVYDEDNGDVLLEYNNSSNSTHGPVYNIKYVQEAYTDESGVEHTAFTYSKNNQYLPTDSCHSMTITDNDGINHVLKFYIVRKNVNSQYSMFYSTFRCIRLASELHSFDASSYPLTTASYAASSYSAYVSSVNFIPNTFGQSQINSQNSTTLTFKKGDPIFMRNPYVSNKPCLAVGPVIPNASFLRDGRKLYWFYVPSNSFSDSTHSSTRYQTLLFEDLGLTEAEVDAKIQAAIDALNAEDTEY